MNKNLVFISLIVACYFMPLNNGFAQTAKNQVKFNLLPLAGNTYAFEYERSLIGRLTAVGMISVRPKSGLPYLSSWKSYIDNDETIEILENTKQGATSFAVEARFYPGKKGSMRGFYIAPYLKHASYSSSLPLSVDFDPPAGSGIEKIEKVMTEGDLKTVSFGLGLGLQFKLSRSLSLDWKIIAPGYGSSSGNLKGRADRNLTADEQNELREQLEDLKEGVPLVSLEPEVDAEGVKVRISGPWAGIRTGLSLGFRF